MNTTENLISTGCTATAPQPINQIIKPVKFPAQPQEWKIVSLRECPTPDTMQQCETPDQAAAYWKTHIATHPYFNSECECLVVFILNTRRRIKGHYLVSIGTMDTILCHPREVFRLAIMASAAAIIIAHNHPSGEPTPSEADIKITRDLIRAGQLLKIEVLDHIVIGNRSHDLRSLAVSFSWLQFHIRLKARPLSCRNSSALAHAIVRKWPTKCGRAKSAHENGRPI
ncbi:MAG: JAB domain-containing protein [Verrucomicrobiota bacterium]